MDTIQLTDAQVSMLQKRLAMEREEADERLAAEELKHLELPRDRLEKASQRNYSDHPWQGNEEAKPFG